MLVKTAKFGDVDINEELVFDFVEPILGYENLKNFALLDHSENSPFKWLQSTEDADIALPVTVPSFFEIDYKFTIPDEKAEVLGAENVDDILSFNIVNIPSGNPQESTINLLGPIVVNVINKKAVQLVLSDPKLSVREKLFKN